jgi:hypothetical protein
MALIDQAVAAGARQARARETVNLRACTLQRWQRSRGQGDARADGVQAPGNRFSELERRHILKTINNAEYGSLPPSQIVPRLADKGIYLAGESTMYRLLRSAGPAL